jgi:hypothetical protein
MHCFLPHYWLSNSPMKPTHTQACPLCCSSSGYYLVDFQQRKHFLCSSCTQFQISIDAEQHLTKAPPDWRAGLSDMARAHPQGTTLVITERNVAGKESATHATLAREYVENSRLPG